MNPLPLLAREFRVALRRPLTARLRLFFGGGSMLLAIWALLVSTGAGNTIFLVLSCLAFLLIIFAGIFLASDSISRERREGTLGFLFLTDLHARDLVLGKFAAAGLVPAYTVLAMFPAFALCQLAGGVSAGLFWRMMLALIGGLGFTLTATLFVSVICEDHRKSYTAATVLLFAASPLWLCWAAFQMRWLSFLACLLTFFLLGVLLLGAAAWLLARLWRNPETGRSHVPTLAGRSRIPREILESFPVGWMMLRRRPARKGGVAVAGGAALPMLVLVLGAPGLGLVSAVWLLFFLHLVYYFVLLTRSAYAFYTDRQDGSLELLLASRLSAEEIFSGFAWFLVRQATPVLVVITIADVSYTLFFFARGAVGQAALCGAMAATLWISLCALGWLGVYRSLMMNHPSLAMIGTFARLSLFPLLLSFLFLAAPQTEFQQVAAFCVGSSLFLALFFSIDAKAALREHGRALLLRPYTEKPPHIESSWSFIDWEEAGRAA